jgi:hypothetical protein
MIAIPANEEQLALCLADPMWRLENLYYILVKTRKPKPGEDPDSVPGKKVLFKMNRAQRRFLSRLWNRNVVLKARQVGITTLICILWLDHALFVPDQRCGIVAQDEGAAKAIFRDKVKYAYDNLPPQVKKRFPLAKDASDELLFKHNNSSVRVATSMRSGTLDRLHVSEMGKISAMYPIKAAEVINGSLPAVPDDGIVVVESTAEGREGPFFEMVTAAEKLVAEKRKLTIKDYRLHFTAWWQHDEYRMDSQGVHISDEDHRYFDKIEQACTCRLDLDQRAWYVKTRDTTLLGSAAKMWQEYPSTPEEAFQVSGEGHYYAKDMLALRKRGGIREVPLLDVPVNTFWDIGRSDGCGIWFHQELRGEDRFIHYFEAHNESLGFYVRELQRIATDRGMVFNKHFLPHDAAHKRLSDTNKSTEEMLNDLGLGNTEIVPVITQLIDGIEQVRKNLKGVYIDKDHCAGGINALDGYQKKFSQTDQCWLNEPNKRNGCTEGADSFRQWAQAKENGQITLVHQAQSFKLPPPPDWRM